MKGIKLQDVAAYLKSSVIGDPEEEITGINNIFDARKGDITFLSNPKYADKLPFCQASAIIVSEGVEAEGKNLIPHKNPRLAFSLVVGLVLPKKQESRTISPEAHVGEGTTLGKDVTVYPKAYIGKNTVIGDNSVVYPGVYIGDNVKIGENCYFYPNSTIHDDTVIKNNVTVNSNSVVGSEGFGFAQDGDKHIKVPQIGNVVIEDDVEIGSLCAIDCGSFQATTIGKGTKTDNFVHIGHNCEIGENNLMIAQAGIAGTVKTGKNVYFGGKSGVADNLKIADRTMVYTQSIVSNDITEPGMYCGFPARTYAEWTKASALFYKADEQRKKMMAMERRLKALEAKLAETEGGE